MTYQIKVGSNLDVLPTLPDNSVDSIVTDPPYELGFMGKSWDASGIAYNVTLWRECLRVLKPGGHLLAFSGSRTYHRMTCAIEDAGFQVRDQIMWVYGSGFPKSFNISKGIDKMDAVEAQHARRLDFTAWVRGQGVTAKQINDATQTSMGCHYITEKEQPAVMTLEHLNACRHLFKEIPEWVTEECAKRSVESENFKSRKVIETVKRTITDASTWGAECDAGMYKVGNHVFNITSPATPEAKQWDGWGTALKPAHEPICVARKPLEGTVAENVLKWGVGGLNVDGCRVGTDGGCAGAGAGAGAGARVFGNGLNGTFAKPVPGLGRWPANLIHDGSDEVVELMPSTARFFYCAKASKKDRDDGCKNTHPTVKPTDLMAYLCRLVTPPNGTILDPFTGSGSTGRGAILGGFNFIGIELSAEYAQIAEARIKAVAQL
jgi:hypothetical protein